MIRYLALPLLLASASGGAQVVRSEADLPTTRYPLAQPASQIYATAAFQRETLARLRTDAERLLSTRKIEDPAIARRLRRGLIAIALLEHRPADARRLIAEQRAGETKPQERALSGMIGEAIAAAQIAGDRCDAATTQLAATLASADPAVVRDEVIARYSTVQTASVGFHAATAVILVDPEVKAQRSVSLMNGMLLAHMAFEARLVPPCRAALRATMRRWIDDPSHRVADIWATREPAGALLARAAPVTVAVWEGGFDADLFPGQIAFDPTEPLDGRDNDRNGVVDDAFGPTFDEHMRPTPARLSAPSRVLADRLGLQIALEKGLLDLRFGDDTPEARFVATRAQTADPAEQIGDGRASEELLTLMHGSWVASIIADPAPFVRLYTIKAFPDGNDPDPLRLDEADYDRWAEAMSGIGKRLRDAGVRVVNMSWGFEADRFAEKLLECGVETDPARAKVRGQAIYARLRTALHRMIRDAPGVLFVAAAGNSDQPDDIAATIPQTLGLPNLLVVGGTGQGGRPTAFTTFGKSVALYGPAEGIPVRGMGGVRMRASGTSFSAPFATRVAASMLALSPSLSPAQLIEGMTATATPGDSGIQLIDAGAAARWAVAR